MRPAGTSWPVLSRPRCLCLPEGTGREMGLSPAAPFLPRDWAEAGPQLTQLQAQPTLEGLGGLGLSGVASSSLQLGHAQAVRSLARGSLGLGQPRLSIRVSCQRSHQLQALPALRGS